MNPEDWARIKALFHQAVSLPPMARTDFVRAQPDPPPIIEEALRLVQNHLELESGFLDPPPFVNQVLNPDRALLSVGDLLANRFRVQRFVGAGGMGQVYEALDEVAGICIALKVLIPPLQRDPEAEARFRRELLIARLVTHPNVCRLFDIGKHESPQGSMVFLTMEFLEGETLAEHLRREARYSPSDLKPILNQVAAGLQAAHTAGVIHRDLKPGNIMLTKSGRVVLTDFGLAREPASGDRSVLDSTTQPGSFFGTIDYMAPEQLIGAPLTPAVDLYALGLIAYEALTGKPAFPGATPIERATNKLTRDPAGLSVVVTGLPASWQRAIESCLARDPASRPKSVELFLQLAAIDERPAWRNRISRRVAIPTLVGTVSLSILILRLLDQRPKGTRGVSVILARADASDSVVMETTLLQMIKSLGQSEYLQLWDARRLPEVLQRMARPAGAALNARDWREVALREAVPFVLFVSVGRVGDGFSVAMRLEQVQGSPGQAFHGWQKSFEARSQDQFLKTIDEACRWARPRLGRLCDCFPGQCWIFEFCIL